jgi:hypothetical protein
MPSSIGSYPGWWQAISNHIHDDCLRLLGARLLDLYGTDKKQLKRLRTDYPALAPHLLKP